MLRLLDVEDLRFAAWMSFFMLCQAAGFAAVLVQYLCIDSGQPAYAVAKGSAQSIQASFLIVHVPIQFAGPHQLHQQHCSPDQKSSQLSILAKLQAAYHDSCILGPTEGTDGEGLSILGFPLPVLHSWHRELANYWKCSSFSLGCSAYATALCGSQD